MKNLIVCLLILFNFCLLSAACLGHSPGEVYFEAYTKDASGYYTVPALYRTRDYGVTAEVVINNFDGFIYRDAKPGSFYKRIFGQGFFYSPDTCKTWVQRNGFSSVQSSPYNGEIFYEENLSRDFGATWSTMQCNGLNGSCPSSWGVLQGEMYSLQYASSSLKKLYRSTDYGNNFTFVSDITIPNTIGVGRGIQAGELILSTYNLQTDERIFYRSLDYGLTFEFLYQLPESMYSLNSVGGFIQNERILYKINRYNHPYYNKMDIKFFRTTDLYQTIDSVNTNYTSGIEDNGQFAIDNVQLVNYPNPFNNSTVISYTLTTENSIALTVYNANGELVKSLYEGFQSSGSHSITLNADGLNSGIYYIKLSGKNISQTNKCILVK